MATTTRGDDDDVRYVDLKLVVVQCTECGIRSDTRFSQKFSRVFHRPVGYDTTDVQPARQEKTAGGTSKNN